MSNPAPKLRKDDDGFRAAQFGGDTGLTAAASSSARPSGPVVRRLDSRPLQRQSLRARRTAGGEPLYFDSDHLSRPAVLEAVPAIEQRLVDAGLLPVALSPRR